MIKNLIIAAHPDDEIIGCGGTINKLIKKGETVNIVFMAEGVTSRYEKKEIHSITSEQAEWRLKNWKMMIANYRRRGYSYPTISRIKKLLVQISKKKSKS